MRTRTWSSPITALQGRVGEYVVKMKCPAVGGKNLEHKTASPEYASIAMQDRGSCAAAERMLLGPRVKGCRATAVIRSIKSMFSREQRNHLGVGPARTMSSSPAGRIRFGIVGGGRIGPGNIEVPALAVEGNVTSVMVDTNPEAVVTDDDMRVKDVGSDAIAIADFAVPQFP